jgi:hypothetical protein
MRSPFTARGTVSVPASQDASAARALAFQLSRSLTPLRAKEIDVGEEHVTFRGAVLRAVWGWSLLGPSDWVSIRMRSAEKSVEVDYELRLVEAPLWAIAVSCVMALPSLLFGEFITGVGAFLVFCGFFGGINHLLTHWRFQRFVVRVLRRANRRTMPPS